MTYTLQPLSPTGTILLVGCGGTGGFVAEGLCRLLVGNKDRAIFLVDHDRVEKSNLGRQNFYAEDLGRFKAQVLAERLSRQFGRPIEYNTGRIEELSNGWRGNLTIGCVDNPKAREKLVIGGETGIMHNKVGYGFYGGWYIDAGNSENSGQVLIGNAFVRELSKAFVPNSGRCNFLPLPQIQQPALLAPVSRRRRRRNCAEAVAAEEQSPIINRMMADLIITFVYKLLKGTLTWMGAYINLETGTLSTVDATPEVVSRITGHTVRQLEYRPRAGKGTNE